MQSRRVFQRVELRRRTSSPISASSEDNAPLWPDGNATRSGLKSHSISQNSRRRFRPLTLLSSERSNISRDADFESTSWRDGDTLWGVRIAVDPDTRPTA